MTLRKKPSIRLEPGDTAPSFELRDGEGKTWNLDDLRGTKVVLFFYPADNTPGCTAEACDFRDSRADFERAGYTVLGISPQGSKSHRSFASKHGLDFPLLCDTDREVATAYGVTQDLGSFAGIPLRVRRSTFVIDDGGRIEHALYGVHARGHVDDLRATLDV